MGAFVQRGNTKRITARSVAGSAIQMSAASGFPPTDNYIITNFGPETVFVGTGSTSSEARNNAQVSASGDETGKFCFIVPPGQRGFEAKDGVYIAAVTVSGIADVFITPGKGEIEGGSLGGTTSTADSSSLLSYESGTEQDLLRAILIELRTVTCFLKEGLNVAEDPDLIRGDQTNSIL